MVRLYILKGEDVKSHSYSFLFHIAKDFQEFRVEQVLGITSPDFSLKLSWRFHHDFSLNFAMNVPLKLHKRSQFNELPQRGDISTLPRKGHFLQIVHFGVHRILEIPVGALKKGERNLLAAREINIRK